METTEKKRKIPKIPGFSVRTNRDRWATLLRIGALIIGLSPFYPPILHKFGAHVLATKIIIWWAPLCHRMPVRSLRFLGEILPMCSRCLGIVIGAGVGGILAWPFFNLRVLRIWVGAAAGFLCLEMLTQDLGWHGVFHPTRLLSGFLFAMPIGAAVGYLLTKGPTEKMRSEWDTYKEAKDAEERQLRQAAYTDASDASEPEEKRMEEAPAESAGLARSSAAFFVYIQPPARSAGHLSRPGRRETNPETNPPCSGPGDARLRRPHRVFQSLRGISDTPADA